VPPPLVPEGGGHTRWGERGSGSPNSDEGAFTVVLYSINIYCIYFVVDTVIQNKVRKVWRHMYGAGHANLLKVEHFSGSKQSIKTHLTVSAKTYA
jgi:hypothetical protein